MTPSRRVLLGLGIVLVLGGIGHAFGVSGRYLTAGIPETRHVLLDIWVGEIQILGGSLYIASAISARAERPWRTLAAFGAATVVSWAVPILPVLYLNAPIRHCVPPLAYLVLSVWILIGLWRPVSVSTIKSM